MRAKWSAPIRKYWKISEQMMVKYCDLAICDSVNIEKYIHECYDRKGIKGKNPKTTFIAYGADLTLSKLADDDEKLMNWYKEKGLSKKDYYLVVGRFVPENSFEVMIREFMKSGCKKDFALITNVNDKFLNELEEKLHFKALQELAEQGNANLTLMGIEPTYPSEKYGYIIPESGENVSKVKEFKEKPDVGTAKKYLAQSALWNAGIFAFKLGYLLDKAHSMIDFEDYRDLFNKYDTLTKISFDYAVVEKESSIQVLRYSGDWKDVGTWNMMAEVMADKTKGKAVLDEICENTNVVNELNIPILCMGCKDMIIAASGDGILISDKERSGYMKPYVEKIETEAMYAEKSWGTYTVIDVQPGSMTVKISMKAGEKMSYHMHNEREEVWTVVSGKGKAIVDGMEQVLRTGDVITIAAGCKHTVEAIYRGSQRQPRAYCYW